MEDPANIIFVCKECGKDMYPNKGKLNANIGEFAKLKFVDECGTEYMWVKVTGVDKKGEKYKGILDNDPVLVLSVRYGDNIEFEKEDILDVTK